MSRLKLLLFAVPALALWLTELSLTASSFSEKAEAQAAAYATRGIDAVSVRVAGRRSELQGLALRLGSSPGAWATLEALRAGKQELAADRLAGLRRTASDAVSTALRPGLVIGVRTDTGAVFARGNEPPAPTLPGLETDAVAGAGSDGQTREAFGTSHLFFSFPLLGPEKEGRQQGILIVGGPLLPAGTADQVALETGLSALGVVQAGKLMASGGPEKARLPEALRETPVGKSAVAVRGSPASFGFLKLPLFTSGPEPALRMALRRGVPGQPVELLALASTEPAMTALADSQRFALGAILFLLAALAALWVWMGQETTPFLRRRRQEEEVTEETRPRRTLFGIPTSTPRPVQRLGPEPSRAIELAQPEPPPPPPPEPATMVNSLGPHSVAEHAAPSKSRTAVEDLSALLDSMPPPPEPTPAPVPRMPVAARVAPLPPPRTAPPPAPLDYDHQPTTAYPVPNLPDFNLPPASALGPGANAIPEATRVQDVPADLLASTRPPPPAPPQRPPAVKARSSQPPPDDIHFQDVFHEFLAMRERCGEPGDGLTFEKFVGKLRKNRDQLVKKYGCRTVRFQVYVKEGRAALKATPVRD
jgi:hypothetical protein